jgi:hypothetical protein
LTGPAKNGIEILACLLRDHAFRWEAEMIGLDGSSHIFIPALSRPSAGESWLAGFAG